MRRHAIDVNFEFNTLIMFSFFCSTHCCQFSIKIYDITREKENFLFSKEFQRVWKLEDQEFLFSFSHVISFRFVLFAHKKQFNHVEDILVTYKKQFSSRHVEDILVTFKKSFNSRFSFVENDIFNRIIQVIQREYQFKIKYRSSVNRHTFFERRVYQTSRSSII